MARLLLFGGKGGVGKTTTSSATAVWLADSGLRVLLVSSDPAHSTSDSLGVNIGSKVTPIEGVDGLWGLEMDPEAKISALLPKVGSAMEKMNSSGGLGSLGETAVAMRYGGSGSIARRLPGAGFQRARRKNQRRRAPRPCVRQLPPEFPPAAARMSSRFKRTPPRPIQERM